MGNSSSSGEERPPPPPSSTRDCPSTAAREQIAVEMLATEETYIKGLETMLRVFGKPFRGLEKKALAELGMTMDDVDLFFDDVEDLIALHASLRSHLKSRLTRFSDRTKLGPIFSPRFLNPMLAPYTRVITRNEAAQARLKHLMAAKKTGSKFKAFVKAAVADEVAALTAAAGSDAPMINAMAYDLSALLLTPIQRIPRYLLLLKDLVKRTPASHADARPLAAANAAVEAFAASLNEARHIQDAREKFAQLAATFVDLPPNLAASLSASTHRARLTVDDVAVVVHIPPPPVAPGALATWDAVRSAEIARRRDTRSSKSLAAGRAVVLEGMLGMATTPSARTYNERWFRLHANGQLVFWKSEAETATAPAEGVVVLTDVVALSLPAANTLHLATLSRGLTLVANSPSDAQAWTDAFRSVLRNIFVVSPPWLDSSISKPDRKLYVLDDMLVVTKHTTKRLKKVERYKAHAVFARGPRRLPLRSVRVVDTRRLLGVDGDADASEIVADGEAEPPAASSSDASAAAAKLYVLDVFTTHAHYDVVSPALAGDRSARRRSRTASAVLAGVSVPDEPVASWTDTLDAGPLGTGFACRMVFKDHATLASQCCRRQRSQHRRRK
ncbi:uncharacterized protein AMSG_07266 [Thecamonas trahens ATCC 50062]|uniref:DH domain-containing protein n=1 Tax=Thecamonas trahens ATCC 50062 TaxID=461836 RepID=A0A0L0DIV9_THETB|nr:hypothetical protein AMSG_07266 [Thecamonas trahens ATCC 50062]KNC51263.1 hypothetical protein AMSG_07266 [Thecamonas trahens ATCC 50062]|eukprot:XP_013756193.1 hypothetical protein AMSG_07266 [Thecamonas trahens ATCC 50062]